MLQHGGAKQAQMRHLGDVDDDVEELMTRSLNSGINISSHSSDLELVDLTQISNMSGHCFSGMRLAYIIPPEIYSKAFTKRLAIGNPKVSISGANSACIIGT